MTKSERAQLTLQLRKTGKVTADDLLIYDNVPPQVAAKYLGVGDMFVMCGLRDGVLPFGVAVKMKGYRYYISAQKLIAYKEGKELPSN